MCKTTSAEEYIVENVKKDLVLPFLMLLFIHLR